VVGNQRFEDSTASIFMVDVRDPEDGDNTVFETLAFKPPNYTAEQLRNPRLLRLLITD
jgi:hypothetical protein